MRSGRRGHPARLPGEPRLDRRQLLALGAAGALTRLGRDEHEADVVIVGAGLGGCAAALAAAAGGARVVLTEPTTWVGGQLTSQLVPPDEHRWIEEKGAPASWRALREAVRARYRERPDLAVPAGARNPGRGWVSRLCAEPGEWLAALEDQLAPHLASGRITLLREATPVDAEVDGDRVRAVTVALPGGERRVLHGAVFLDATEEGDLLPLAGVEHVTGSEGDTGEAHASGPARPTNLQACTWCMAVEHHPGEDHVGDPPQNYARWRAYVPELEPAWSGQLLSLVASHPITLEPRRYHFAPDGRRDPEGAPDLWSYRRIRDATLFTGGPSVTVLNWPQNDYLLGPTHGEDAASRARHLAGAQELTRALLYWLQTEAPGPGDRPGWPGLRPSPLSGREDGLALAPYVRESRRLRAEFTVLEQHVVARRGRTLGEPFPDSVGVGSYRLDLHPTTGGDNYVDLATLPFRIPLGALLPVRVENLLAAAKNIGTTHITGGCYRLHPVEWSVGEAAGVLAARCAAQGVPPRQVRADPVRLADLQAALVQRGAPVSW